jgi:hypothetical protein
MNNIAPGLELVPESGFLMRHLLCGRPSWPEGRPPTPAELPHLTTHIETFDTFVEVTWTCAVCRATGPAIAMEIAAWRHLMASARAH